MSTLHHLDMALIDIRDRFTKELQFSDDAMRQLDAAFETAFESLNHLQATVKNAFSERRRALATALGSTGPLPETIDMQSSEQTSEPARKPKLVKAAAAGGEG